MNSKHSKNLSGFASSQRQHASRFLLGRDYAANSGPTAVCAGSEYPARGAFLTCSGRETSCRLSAGRCHHRSNAWSRNAGNIGLETYDAAAAELTVLLRSADEGRLWNHPLIVTNGSESYHLRLQPAHPDTWAPDDFTSFKLASSIQEKYVKTPIEVAGVGGALVGVRLVPGQEFAPSRGSVRRSRHTRFSRTRHELLPFVARQSNQQLALKAQSVGWGANYSAPLLYYKHINETLTGLAGAFAISHFAGRAVSVSFNPTIQSGFHWIRSRPNGHGPDCSTLSTTSRPILFCEDAISIGNLGIRLVTLSLTQLSSYAKLWQRWTSFIRITWATC